MPRPFLIFVPGLMGTELYFDGDGGRQRPEPVWSGDVFVLLDSLTKNPATLLRPLRVGSVLRSIKRPLKPIYGPLLDFLSDELGFLEGLNFVSFGYDWRLDNRVAAATLASLMRSKVEVGVKHFALVAHSMGSIVVRLLLADPENSDLAARTALFVQIGPPVLGSSKAFYSLKESPELPYIFEVIMRFAPTSIARLIESVRSFSSLYQLLPPESEHILISESGDQFSAVDEKAWLPQYRTFVAGARPVLDSVECLRFGACRSIFSTEVLTEHDYMVDADFNIISKREPLVRGDGRVSIASAKHGLNMDQCIPIRQYVRHEQIPNTLEVWSRLADLLTKVEASEISDV